MGAQLLGAATSQLASPSIALVTYAPHCCMDFLAVPRWKRAAILTSKSIVLGFDRAVTTADRSGPKDIGWFILAVQRPSRHHWMNSVTE